MKNPICLFCNIALLNSGDDDIEDYFVCKKCYAEYYVASKYYFRYLIIYINGYCIYYNPDCPAKLFKMTKVNNNNYYTRFFIGEISSDLIFHPNLGRKLKTFELFQ